MSIRPLLIVNADDFGLNAAATDGIIECHRAGSVTSTTLMVNADDSARAAELARAHPGLGVGLHFNLTWGRPVGRAVAGLTDGGCFVPRSALALRWAMRRLSMAAVRDELEAQLTRMAELGLAPTHIDSHQHVHAIPVVFSAVADACRARGIPMRVPWIGADGSGGLGRRARQRVLRALLARGIAYGRDVASNTSLSSVFDLPRVADVREFGDAHYAALLHGRSGVHELMVHTVVDGAAMHGYTRIGAVAEREFRYLRGPGLRRLAEERGWRLGNYRDVPPLPSAR